MSSWGQHLTAAALVFSLLGTAQAGSGASASSPGEAAPAAAANPALAAARALGLPAGVLGAGGMLWLLFSQGKTLQENTEAWGKLSRRWRGQGTTRPGATRAAATVPTNSGRRFAVGFSYAGEDRAVVAPIAEHLAERLTQARVLYDKFHEAELARPDLDVYLPRLYRDQSELIVVVLSPDYPKKRWCGLEWRWIRQLILSESQGRIMLLQSGQPGDLSELGILSGDGYLDISQRPAEAVAEKILERMVQQGIAVAPSRGAEETAGAEGSAAAGGGLGLLTLPADPAFLPKATRSRMAPRAAAISGVALALLAAGFWAGRPLLARWHLDQGDQAFLAFAKLGDEGQIQKAGQAWRHAKDLDPQQPEAHARLGFLADILDNLSAAEAHWRQAAGLAPENTPQGQGIRNGLANVLAQEPGQRQAALAMYDADRFYPRSALEAAMLRWATPGQMGQAQDAVGEQALDDSLAGDGASQTPWGFKENGALLLFESRAHQRCLLANVRATTAHLAGSPTAAGPTLTSPDCQGVQASVRDLLCSRLAAARANARAPGTATWLGCPKEPQGGSAKEGSA